MFSITTTIHASSPVVTCNAKSQSQCTIKLNSQHTCLQLLFCHCIIIMPCHNFKVLFLTVQLFSNIIPPSFLLAQYKQGQSGLSKTSLDSKQESHNAVVSNLPSFTFKLFKVRVVC